MTILRPIIALVTVALCFVTACSAQPSEESRGDSTPVLSGNPDGAELYTNFAGKPDGPAPDAFDTGQPAFAATNTEPAGLPRITQGRLTFDPNDQEGALAGYYLTGDLHAPVTRIGYRWVLTPHAGESPGVAAIAVTDTPATFDDGSSPEMPLHLIVDRNGWDYSVAPSRSAGGVELVSIGRGNFSSPLIVDGITEYTLEVCLENDTATLLFPDGSRRTVEDPRIGAWRGNYAYFEPYSPTGNPDAVAGFTEVWASTLPC